VLVNAHATLGWLAGRPQLLGSSGSGRPAVSLAGGAGTPVYVTVAREATGLD